MSYKVEFRMRGQREMRERLEAFAFKHRDRAGKALESEGDYQGREAQEVTPYGRGKLRASLVISDPIQDGDDILVKIGMGGSLPYAMAQHQKYFKHDQGARRFLEDPVKKNKGKMLKRIAQELRIA